MPVRGAVLVLVWWSEKASNNTICRRRFLLQAPVQAPLQAPLEAPFVGVVSSFMGQSKRHSRHASGAMSGALQKHQFRCYTRHYLRRASTTILGDALGSAIQAPFTATGGHPWGSSYPLMKGSSKAWSAASVGRLSRCGASGVNVGICEFVIYYRLGYSSLDLTS